MDALAPIAALLLGLARGAGGRSPSVTRITRGPIRAARCAR